MPSYMLECSSVDCGHVEEVLMAWDDAVTYPCEVCGARTDFQLNTSALHNLPTPRFHGKVLKSDDPGFLAEIKSIADGD